MAALLGGGCALALARAGAPVRVVVLAGLICLLALPAPPLGALPDDAVPLAHALGRALALVALFCIPSAASIPSGLWRAALAAGARPLRAWFDVVLSQVWLPAVIGVVAAWLRR